MSNINLKNLTKRVQVQVMFEVDFDYYERDGNRIDPPEQSMDIRDIRIVGTAFMNPKKEVVVTLPPSVDLPPSVMDDLMDELADAATDEHYAGFDREEDDHDERSFERN